jgi:hypothetical protein
MGLRSALCGIFGLLFCAATGCEGQRLIEARIERDGQIVLQSQFGIADDAAPEAVWRSIAEQRFKAVAQIVPQRSDPTKATLNGKIRILLRHAGNRFASADVDQLQIVLAPGTDVYWIVTKDEVERTAKLAEWK